MVVITQKDNVHLFGHAHCFVGENDCLGYAWLQLKRDVKVIGVETELEAEYGETICATAILNIENPLEKDLENIEFEVIEYTTLGEKTKRSYAPKSLHLDMALSDSDNLKYVDIKAKVAT